MNLKLKTDDQLLQHLKYPGSYSYRKELKHRLKTRQKKIEELQKVADEAVRILTNVANHIKQLKRKK